MVRHWDGTRWLNIPDGVTGPSGPQGPLGASGPTGASGAAGASGASGVPGTPAPVGQDYFLYEQEDPAGSWLITHTLQRPCAVTVLDTGGTIVEADVYFVSASVVLVEFTMPVAGKAYLT